MRTINVHVSEYPISFHIPIVFLVISSLQVVLVSSLNQISFTVTENCVMNYVVGDMSVYRAQNRSAVNNKIYSMECIENDQFKDLFVINSLSGLIRVNRIIDRELICPKLTATSGTCSVTLLVTILNEIMNIAIIIVDENDNAPSFPQASVSISVKESLPVGTKIYLKHAKDLDSVYNGIGDYILTSEVANTPLRLRYNSSVIYLDLTDNLDYETCTMFSMTLSVCDIGTPRLCTSQNVRVMVVDVNDNYPQFSQSSYLAIINEDLQPGREVLRVVAIDKDSRQYGAVKYRLADSNHEATKWFRLDSNSGQIFLIRSLALRIRNVKFVVEAYDNGPIPNINRTMVAVHINDINNHSPVIKIRKSTFVATITDKDPQRTEVSFFENNPKNSDVVFVVVSDDDSEDNGLVRCSMDVTQSGLFQLRRFNTNGNKVIYRLVVLESMDCEYQKKYMLRINCTDSGTKPKWTLHVVDIVIADVNEYAARFNQSSYVASVRENSVTFAIAMPIVDEDCNVDYSIDIADKYARAKFKYVITTQQLVLSSELDYEERQSIIFTVKIIDKGGDTRVLYSTTTIDITVLDMNDNSPQLMEPTTFFVEENSRIGIIIGQLRANDSDQNQNSKVQFQTRKSSSPDDHNFFVTSEGEIKLARQLDRERQEVYLITVDLVDMGSPPLSSSGTFTVVVGDVNDNGPQWVFPNLNDNKVNESVYTTDGVIITRVHAVDSDGPGNNNISYHLAKDHSRMFTLHPIKGELSFASAPQAGLFTLDLVATDNGSPQRSNRTKLIVFVSDRELTAAGSETFASRSYFTIVAVVPIFILICLLMLILCLLLVVRRRSNMSKNRRNQLKHKVPENIVRKESNQSATNEKLLVPSMIELNTNVTNPERLDALDLTQIKSLPKVSYQCLVGTDLDVCSADSGQGASEEDFSNYFMMKSNDSYRTGPCNQHCCAPLPENSIAHFVCSTMNNPMLFPQCSDPYTDESTLCPYSIPKLSAPTPNIHSIPNLYKLTCVNSSCNHQ